MLKPVCVKCHRFFQPYKNGVYFTEGMPIENDAPKGLEAPEKWGPYKVWCGDKLKCKGCGTEIIAGFALAPLTEHYMDNFKQMQEHFGADSYQVNDC